MIRTAITATGSYIPDITVTNDTFQHAQFYEGDGNKMYRNNKIIIDKFREITGITERRYARPDQQASDLGYLAAQQALSSSGIDPESLDYIIVAHNFGDVAYESNRVNLVPTVASRIKALLGIANPDCVAYDLPFGCPGWVEGVIQADYFIRSGDAKRCMVIGTETLSRVIDPHDRDSMIFSDGGGAAILEAQEDPNRGILAHKTQTHALEHAMLNMGKSYSPFTSTKSDLFIKMQGRKVYEFALKHVPLVIKTALDRAGIGLDQVRKVLIHQANEKMDVAILERVFRLYGKPSIPADIMPMTIGTLGNSSVATVPTLLDLLLNDKLNGHRLEAGDHYVMASVGAGMNINAVVCRH
ncbi:MAG: ketoacyl-ACP synthase III [Cyclobacteriaceae bacterium]|nr:ketoacyl-ACP synthase III [Cyclobacteriaceae bacterium]